jgi:hypothetical protein
MIDYNGPHEILQSDSMTLSFDVRDAEEGGFYARALGHSIFTEADNWNDLRSNILEAVLLHFADSESSPRWVHLRYTKVELIPLGTP